jgi:predicted Zn-dependent protease
LNIRFSENNVRPQCPLCNIFKNGEQYVFGKNLEASGVNVVKLQKESKKKVKNPRELYEWVIKEYTERLKNL